jgi:hypothetical protein
MRKILLLLTLAGTAGAGADDTVTVYQLTGGVQCADEGGIPAEKAADLLRAQGVKVLATGRNRLPLELPRRCGAPTGEANVITVAAADWSAFVAQNPDAGGYGLWIFDNPQVQVYKYDGTLQCGLGQEVPLDEMAKELKGSGIEVLNTHKGTDGLTHISVCGASTGAINAFEIRRDLLPAAQKLGYRMLVTHDMLQEIKPRMQRISAAPSSVPQKRTSPAPIEPAPLLW